MSVPSSSAPVLRPNSGEIIPTQPELRRPTDEYLPNAHHTIEIHGSRFYEISGGFHRHAQASELDRLQKFISEDAFYDSRARFPPPKCHPGTRVEDLRIIEDWIYDPNPSQRIFWLNGPAGAGKSAITQTIAEYCKDTQLAASFFFERDTPDRGVVDRLFPTLAWQLALSIPEICPYLESMLRTEHSIHAKSINVQFDRLFVRVFEQLFRDKPYLCLQRSLVILDAVDECGTELDQKMFLELVGVEMASQRIPLRFLISSRPEPHIRGVFNTDSMKSIARVLVLNIGPENDIRKYLEDEIPRIFLQRGIPPPPSIADAINCIVSEASGQFIHASASVKFIDDADQNPRTQLDSILGSSSSPQPRQHTGPSTRVNIGNAYSDYPADLWKLQTFISEGASYDSRARCPPPRCHPGTRAQVLNMITEWIGDPNPPQRIFLLSGPAGVGKSAIAQTIAELCRNTHLAASFFFQRNTSDRGVADRLFLTLAWQLAKSIRRMRPHLGYVLRVGPFKVTHIQTINIQFRRLFLQAFALLHDDEPGIRPEKNLVIIDALDECDSERDLEIILTLIGKALASRSIPLRFLICSRPEPHIQKMFNIDLMNQITRVVGLDGSNDDIRKYLEDEILRIFVERPPPEAGIIDRLVSDASGQFIYASTIIKLLDDPDHDPQEQLDTILNRPQTSLHTPLDQLYIQILSQQSNIRLLRDVLVLVVAFGRVDIKFVCRRLRKTKKDLIANLHRIRSILKISDVAIEAWHISLCDLLQDKKRAGKYYIHPMRVALVRHPQRMKRKRILIRVCKVVLSPSLLLGYLIAGAVVFRGKMLAIWLGIWLVMPAAALVCLSRNRILWMVRRITRKQNTDSAA